MKLPARLSVLFFIGMFVAGSSALGYYYYFVYSPPLKAAEHFMADMEKQDQKALRADIIVSKDIEEGKLHEPTDFELRSLLSEPFQRGRILDQRRYGPVETAPTVNSVARSRSVREVYLPLYLC